MQIGCHRFAGFIKRVVTALTGADILLGLVLRQINIAHSVGGAIGKGAVVEDRCMTFSGVVLGGTSTAKGREGWECAISRISNNCALGAGAKLTGPIEEGRNSIVGANSVETEGMPGFSIAAGVPAPVIGSTLDRSAGLKVVSQGPRPGQESPSPVRTNKNIHTEAKPS